MTRREFLKTIIGVSVQKTQDNVEYFAYKNEFSSPSLDRFIDDLKAENIIK